MSTALVTFATGRHLELLRISAPLFRRYAERHGYAYIEGAEVRPLVRPPSWWKIPALMRALETHDAALWLDADVVIANGEIDVASLVATDAWQALVEHHTPDGAVPNCGVWFVRKAMLPVLARLWQREQYIHHAWWEQAAMLDALGYRHEPRPCRLEHPTDLYLRTHWLPLEWNSHEQDDRAALPFFAHVSPNTVDWRLPIMRAYAEGADW